MEAIPIDPLAACADARLCCAPRAYTTRRVPREAMRALDTRSRPRAGDLVLARIEALGHHTRLHLPDGRRRHLFVGQEIILTYADRYAPSQFEAIVPPDQSPCELVASGGIAGRVVARHARIRTPSRIRPLGLVTSGPGAPPLNVAGWALEPPRRQRGTTPTLAAVGTAMDAGKTTAIAYLARGLRLRGRSVGYAKVTGTGAAGDPLLVADAGADPVLDFTDAGYASTYRVPRASLVEVLRDLVGHLRLAGVDAILLEVADGLFQRETAMLLEDAAFAELTDGLVLAASDALGAAAGVAWLRERGHRVCALTGRLEAAPLQRREAEGALGIPVMAREELADPVAAAKLLDGAREVSGR